MEFSEVIEKRRSIRAFTDQAVEPEKLQQILQAANQAPSAGNLQAYEIYVVTDPEKRQELAVAALGQEFVASAPLALVFCTHPQLTEERYSRRGIQLYTIQDATIACTIAMLAVTNLGLGSVWIGAFDEMGVHQIVGSPERQVPVAILSIGYPAESPNPRRRRNINQLAHWID